MAKRKRQPLKHKIKVAHKTYTGAIINATNRIPIPSTHGDKLRRQGKKLKLDNAHYIAMKPYEKATMKPHITDSRKKLKEKALKRAVSNWGRPTYKGYAKETIKNIKPEAKLIGRKVAKATRLTGLRTDLKNRLSYKRSVKRLSTPRKKRPPAYTTAQQDSAKKAYIKKHFSNNRPVSRLIKRVYK